MLQRTQFETQTNKNDLALIFFDPIGGKKSQLLRDIYYDIQTKGDFVKDYKNVNDSLNLEYSHHSTGIQIADFLAGLMMGVLKGYDRSIDIFGKAVHPKLRNYHNRILGAGICEIPTDEKQRTELRLYLNQKLPSTIVKKDC